MTEHYLIIRELAREIRAVRPYYRWDLFEDLMNFSLRCDLKNPKDYYSVELASRMEKLVRDLSTPSNARISPISEQLMTKIVETYHDMFGTYSRYGEIFEYLPGGKYLRFPEKKPISIAENIRRRYRVYANHYIVLDRSILDINATTIAQEVNAIAYLPSKLTLFFEDEHDRVLARLSI